jgi:hypothetical protein
MTSWPRRALGALAAAALVVTTAPTADGFATFGSTWADGTITMNLQLTGGAGLADGSASFNAAVASAMSMWNRSLSRVQLATGAGRTRGDGDLINQIFFDSRYYGASFDRDTLAITTRWTLNGTRRVEADIVFNTAFSFDSYRGNIRSSGVWDIRRVALHELGHVLGLDHPDERGQSVNAMMNSILGNLETLTADDIAGVQSLYGAVTATGTAGNIAFPPRNEPNAFFTTLVAAYRDELGAAQSPTHVDPEGAVIWLTEYARQRVGQCSHGSATTNTLNQVTSNGGTLVCANTPAGAIPFPPRNEGLLFMNELDTTYRDALRRPLGSSFVNNEGAVVWLLEYLRYRLNGCNHGDATTKVLQQIRGQGIQPVCTA